MAGRKGQEKAQRGHLGMRNSKGTVVEDQLQSQREGDSDLGRVRQLLGIRDAPHNGWGVCTGARAWWFGPGNQARGRRLPEG